MMALPAVVPLVGAGVVGLIAYSLWGGGKKTSAKTSTNASSASAFKNLVESKGLPLTPTKQNTGMAPSVSTSVAAAAQAIPTPPAGYSYPQARVTTQTDPLNMRSGPGTNYDVIGKIPRGATVEVIKDLGGSWAQVRYSGQVGYASKQYLTMV